MKMLPFLPWARQHLKAAGGWNQEKVSYHCPLHGDKGDRHASGSLDLAEGCYRCHSPNCPHPKGHARQLAGYMGVSTDLMPEPIRKARDQSDEQTDVYQKPDGTDYLKAKRYGEKRYGEKRFAQSRKEGSAWVKGGVKSNPLLHAPKLAQPGPEAVFIVEGEKCARVGNALGLSGTFTTAPEGAGKAHKVGREYWELLRPHTVYLLPDNDEPGRKHMADVADILSKMGIASVTVQLPGLEPKGDLADFVAGRTREKALADLREACKEARLSPKGVSESYALPIRETHTKDVREAHTPATNDDPKKAETDYSKLKPFLDLVNFSRDSDQLYATVFHEGVRRTYGVHSTDFARHLKREFEAKHGRMPNPDALKQAVDFCDMRAASGEERAAHVRVAAAAGKVFWNLAPGKVAEVTAEGWKVTAEASVDFLNPRSSRDLPEPVRGGGLDLLKRFANVTDDGFILVITWLLCGLHPEGTMPILALFGSQGAGKTFIAKILRRLIDPNRAELLSAKDNARDLAISCQAHYILTMDNVSAIPAWLSDAICRLSSGGSYSTRAVYTNNEEAIFSYKRPVLMNGISGMAERQDLAERTLMVELESISAENRKVEADLEREFEEARPLIMGALLDAVAVGLRNLQNVKLDRLPRLADMCRWVVACEPALPWAPGRFLEVMWANRQNLMEQSLEDDPVSQALIKLFENQSSPHWKGTTQQLLEDLSKFAPCKDKHWPENPKTLRKALTRALVPLREAGINVPPKASKSDGLRVLLITKTSTPKEEQDKRPSRPSDPFTLKIATPLAGPLPGPLQGRHGQTGTLQSELDAAREEIDGLFV